MGKTINEFVAEPYTTELGDTINPGDRVAYITHSHSVTMGKGWFDGVFKDAKGNVMFTRVRGVNNTKYVPTDTTKTYSYTKTVYDRETRTFKQVEETREYPEYKEVSCEPHGTALLQRHRIVKLAS